MLRADLQCQRISLSKFLSRIDKHEKRINNCSIDSMHLTRNLPNAMDYILALSRTLRLEAEIKCNAIKTVLFFFSNLTPDNIKKYPSVFKKNGVSSITLVTILLISSKLLSSREDELIPTTLHYLNCRTCDDRNRACSNITHRGQRHKAKTQAKRCEAICRVWPSITNMIETESVILNLLSYDAAFSFDGFDPYTGIIIYSISSQFLAYISVSRTSLLHFCNVLSECVLITGVPLQLPQFHPIVLTLAIIVFSVDVFIKRQLVAAARSNGACHNSQTVILTEEDESKAAQFKRELVLDVHALLYSAGILTNVSVEILTEQIQAASQVLFH